MNSWKHFGLLLILLASLIAVLSEPSRHALAQESQQDSKPAKQEGKSAAEKSQDAGQIDDYQRSAQILYMQRMGKTGADRGQEIYYTKCWICHNDYTRKVDPKAAPTLKGLYTRNKLMSGDPVNDETVTKQIKEGSAGMPSYKAVLSDKDMADLLAYLREKCCWDEMNPAANSRYRGQ